MVDYTFFDVDWSFLWLFGSRVEYKLHIAKRVVVGLACALLGALYHVRSYKTGDETQSGPSIVTVMSPMCIQSDNPDV